MIALAAVVLAQTCASLLPPPGTELEWRRDGRVHAYDVPVRATATQREYRRISPNAQPVTRVLSCTTSPQGPLLVDQVGTDAPARFPITLARTAGVVIDKVVIRRVDPPEGAAAGSLWFSVLGSSPRLIGLLPRVGVAEIRTTTVQGTSALLAQPQTVAAAVRVVAPTPVDSVRLRELERGLSAARQREQVLMDSLALLRLPVTPGGAQSSTKAAGPVAEDPPAVELAPIREQVERGAFDAALALLRAAETRLQAWSRMSGLQLPAADSVQQLLTRTTTACLALQEVRRERREPAPVCNAGGAR